MEDRARRSRPDRPSRSRLGWLLAIVDVVDLVAGSRLRHAGAVLAMMATALVGCAVLFVALALTGVTILVLGLSQGPLAWLGRAVLWVGLIGGFVAAAIVMLKIIRRVPALTVLTGFAEPDEPADAMPRAEPTRPPAERAASTGAALRDLDARLAVRPPSVGPGPDAPDDPSERPR